MALRGTQLIIEFAAWDVSAAPVDRATNDAINMTALLSLDGADFVAATSGIHEVLEGAVHLGIYRLVLTAAEMDCASMYVLPVSMTADVLCEGTFIVTETNTPGTGVYTCTITVQEADGTPIPQASVIIRNAGDTLTVASGTTDAAGQITFYLDNGTYVVRLYKIGVNFTVPEALTVAGNTTDTYIGVPVSGTAPVAGTQSLRGYVVDPSNTPVQSAVVAAQIVEIPSKVDASLISSQKLQDTTDSGGFFELTLIKGVRYMITAVRSSGEKFFAKRITIDSDDTKNLTDY